MKFSVAMCVYGGDNIDYFEIAIQSILKQTVLPDEIVLVVDGPISESMNNLIQSYESSNLFKVYYFNKNMGHGIARRKSLELCTNEIVALMDADDISVNDRFEKQIKYLTSNIDVDLVGGNIQEFIDNVDNKVGKRIVPEDNADIYQYLKKRCPFNQMTVMFKRNKVYAAGGYLDWYCNEDYYLWIRMALQKCKFHNINSVLVNVRVGQDMYKRRGGWRYFISEYNLQKFMLSKNLIGYKIFGINVLKRFIVQVLLPNSIRGWVFRKFARS